ncbi:phosphonoacetaldehyde reductase [Streptomyces sp. NPDC005181]|uniref:phosphonoacetaldehyde reductase n=1 Tax=Streptomyces sp. NPDC005181 TaxID=3156869 RepID=UPI0033A9E89B
MKLQDPVARYGRGAAASVPGLVASLPAQSVLLVHGARSFEVSGAAGMLSGFGRDVRVRRWWDFPPSPEVRDLAQGLSLVRETRPDVVVGVGGGSVMDAAKLLCAFQDVPGDEVEEHVRAGKPVHTRRTKLVLVPTTAGSGSEATHFAVVYIGDSKFSVSGPALLPDATVLDPALSESGSAHQRAASGMDALAQCVESLWAVDACVDSRSFALRGARMLLSAIEDFVLSPHPGAARAMAVGSHLAGRAINLSRTTGAHALSYALTRRYGVSHGHAVALTLGAFMDAHADAGASQLRRTVGWSAHRQALDDIAGLLGAPGPALSGRHFVALGRRLGLHMALADAGVRTSVELRSLAAAVDSRRLSNNPVRFNRAELTELITGC